MRLYWWIGHSGVMAMIAAQLGLAMMPLWPAISRAFTSGTTSGTSESMRKAEELSTTTAPALTAMGAYFREVSPPAENRAISTPAKLSAVSASTVSGSPRNGRVLPAERWEASSLSLPTGKSRRARQWRNSTPTAPVAPTIASERG